MQSTGISLLLDLYDCASAEVTDPAALEGIFVEALRAAGFQVVEQLTHRFPGQGATLITILQQSHAALHTWPEAGYISVDVYSCGPTPAVRAALEDFSRRLAQQLGAARVEARFWERGA